MHRLVLRFTSGRCASVDLFITKDIMFWEDALLELLKLKELLYKRETIENIEAMVYKPGHRYPFHAQQIRVDPIVFMQNPNWRVHKGYELVYGGNHA